MTLLAVISENVLTARGAAARGFIVRDEEGHWELHARCANATVVTSHGRGTWALRDVDGPSAESAGDLLLACAGDHEEAGTLLTAGHLVIAYQGTLDGARLAKILAPTSVSDEAYAMGCSLNVARHEGAIVVGSADALPTATDVREMPSETMIVCRREPVLRSSVLLRGR